MSSPAALRVTPVQAVRHGLALAGRGVARLRTSPERLADVILTPIVSLLVFVHLFGGAIGGGDIMGYRQMTVPGIMVMTVFQAGIGAGVALNADVGSGVLDRFRSLPIARSAPLAGAVLAGVVRSVVALAVLLTLALALGYRIHAGPMAVLAAIVVLLGFAVAFSWISVYVGMLARKPGSVQGLMTVLVLSLTLAGNVFVPAETMPGWLRAWSGVNPVSLTADTVRGLLNGGEVAGPLPGALAWMAGVVAVFLPMAVRAYRERTA